MDNSYQIDLKKASEGGLLETGPSVDETVRVISAVEPRKEVEVPKTCAYPINLDYLAGTQGQIVTLDLTNTTGGNLDLFLGTPFAIPAETVGVGGTAAGTFNGNAGATDRFGASTPFVVTFSSRVVRNPIIVNQIDIITAGDAAGLLQRAERITRINSNYNADECRKAGRFRTFFTENNYVRTNDIAVLSEQWGLVYTIRAGQNIQMDLNISALPIYNFGDSYGTC